MEIKSNTERKDIERSLLLLMAISYGVVVANIYYIQPLLSEIASYFNVSTSTVGIAATLTQLGYVNNLPFSYGKWSYGTRVCREHINFWSGESKKVVVCAQWEDENIRFKMRFYECCDEETWNCRLEDDKLQIERRLNCADHNATIKETLYGVKK